MIEKKLLNNVRKILNKYDPIGIYVDKKTNFEEYDSEIKDIINTFKKSKNLEEFTDRVHKTFKKWFSPEIAGNREKYVELSKELYKLLNNY